ncbi:MAG TPA: hypothetical protein VMC85_06875, partial [Desulfomonilaceae bacterium]|nr:hypothetical protein [Desulfomonilaceae bacterium]
MRLNEQTRLLEATRKHGGNARELPRQIILFSKADWDHGLWTNDQHTAMRLAARGFQILYVESLGLRQPALRTRDIKRIGRRLLGGIRGLRQVREGLWVFSPLVMPFHQYETARRLNQKILETCLRYMLRRLHFRDPILWTYNPLMFFLKEILGASFLVYHCVDDLAAVPGTPTNIVLEADRSMASSADVIFTTSKPLLKTFLTLGSRSIYYFPNVADFEHFSKARLAGPIPHDLESIPAPRIGFVGAVSSYKLDFDLIVGVAERRPDWHWVIIGPWGTEEPIQGPTHLSKP